MANNRYIAVGLDCHLRIPQKNTPSPMRLMRPETPLTFLVGNLLVEVEKVY